MDKSNQHFPAFTPQHADDKIYMRRALQLALLGEGLVSPNPMVGAVIVSADGRIIGEGYHHQYGGPHAEVNAIASVKEEERQLLPQSTIYVTLEPCSHYGKTPPCAELIVRTGLRRVVVGAMDPFPKVSGRGVRMIREAGIEVETGVLEEECRHLNRRFMTAHTLGRPWIELKWAESADGFLGELDEQGMAHPVALSNPLTKTLMHRQRALCDAIMVGPKTINSDNPRLDTRLWPGKNPRPVLFRGTTLPADSPLATRNPIWIDPRSPLKPQMEHLYKDYGITSLLVEGGATILNAFLSEGLADEIRRERSERIIGEDGYGKVRFPEA